MRKSYIDNWKIEGNVVNLFYNDGTIVTVMKNDFDRAFGAIIIAEKEDVIRDFGIWLKERFNASLFFIKK